jgi:hypothetical protein
VFQLLLLEPKSHVVKTIDMQLHRIVAWVVPSLSILGLDLPCERFYVPGASTASMNLS